MQVFSAKAYCKVGFKSAKNSEATNFHGNPYYQVLLYFMTTALIDNAYQSGFGVKLIVSLFMKIIKL